MFAAYFYKASIEKIYLQAHTLSDTHYRSKIWQKNNIAQKKYDVIDQQNMNRKDIQL